MKDQANSVGREAKKATQRDRLIQAMLQQPSLQKAAQMAGISEVTAWRIRQTPAFQEEYRRLRHEAVWQSFARLQQGSSAAAQTILKIMFDGNNPASSRLQAASRVLEFAKGSVEAEDFGVRIRELEDARKADELLGRSPRSSSGD
jgi:hypothetical protein